MEMFTTLIVTMVSWVYNKTDQIAYIKHVQFTVCIILQSIFASYFKDIFKIIAREIGKI